MSIRESRLQYPSICRSCFSFKKTIFQVHPAAVRDHIIDKHSQLLADSSSSVSDNPRLKSLEDKLAEQARINEQLRLEQARINEQLSLEQKSLRSMLIKLEQQVTDNPDLKSLQNEVEVAKQARINEQLRLEQKSFHLRLMKCEQVSARACVGVELCKGDICELKKGDEILKSLIHNDGTYLWRIPNVQELFRNAKNSTQPIYHTSPPFFTSKSGYKLSLRLFLNGDKSVRDTYLSLYVTVMSGEHDSLLKWPYIYPITLTLYDRSSKRDNVVHTLTPDITSTCFEQPRMIANKSGGIPEFCPLWKVFSKEFGYVRQDEMFIGAFVDFDIHEKSSWPQLTQLQAYGLPSHVEHIKLNEIIQKEKH
jgi:hypothetical protein